MTTAAEAGNWTEVGPIDDLRDGRLVKRIGDRQVVVIESDGRLYALDNRCPHEGYPLAVGRVNSPGPRFSWTPDWGRLPLRRRYP